MQTTCSIKDKNGSDVYLTSLDVDICPVCKRGGIAIVSVHVESVYDGNGFHWANCGCRWYIEQGKMLDVHNTVLDEV